MKRKKKMLGILMSAIMVFSMSSQFALAAQTGADISEKTAPTVSTEKGAKPGAKDADKQDKEAPTADKGAEKNISEKNDGVKENDGETKTDQSTEKKESKEDSYNRSPITASKVSRGIAVQVTAPKGSFPEGTTGSVKLVSALKSDVTFDITFTDKDGKEVQPQKGKEVSVNFTVAKSSALIAEKGSYSDRKSVV